jgi:hypothetical protein
MPVLMIDDATAARITELRAFAAATVIDPRHAVVAAERDVTAYRDMMAMHSLEIPIGYIVSYTHENQPVGLCHHISISVTRPGKMPHPEAVQAILGAFGMRPFEQSEHIAIEDVAPETKAINLIQIIAS